MEEKWRKAFLAWARTDDHRRAINGAHNCIKQALLESRPYLSFSGGKDSTVMLHLVLQHAPDIYIYHRYDRAGLEAYEREVQKIAQTLGAENIHTFDFWQDGRPLEGDIAIELQQMGYNATFIGLRKEESAQRRRRITQNIYIIPGFREYWPLADWRWLDVWAYIVSNNLPYVSLYDKRATIMGWDRVRFSTFFDPDLSHIGTSAMDGIIDWRHRHNDPRRREKFARERQ